MYVHTAWIDLIAVGALILANGFFSAAEISIVALRKSRISQLISEGRRAAHTVAGLKDDPTRFIATAQIGITVVASMASVIAGAWAIRFLEPQLRTLLPSFLTQWTEFVSLAITVVAISYFTLVFGELAPKSLALRHSERLSL